MADRRRGRTGGWRGLALATVAAAALAAAAAGQDEPDGEPPPLDQDLEALLEDIGGMDIEQLMEVPVTSVTGRAQPLIDTPAAIFVITPEDIRRTGHRSIAEALRMVPGIQVGQISPSIWAVGSRGFPERFSTDLLVLIDGRTVYDPLYSGVFWHVQDVLLEDLDRIEVIRGPGATLWGANAVNGVINITTKSARDTQGLFVQGGGGNVHEDFGAIRYGGAISDDAHFRVWGKYDNHDSFDDLTGADTNTDWDAFRGGFRFDFDGEDDTHLTVQGDVYGTNHIGENVRVAVPGAHLLFANVALDEEYNGGNVLLRAERKTSDVEGWSVQTYYDRAKTQGGQPGFDVRRDTFDVDYRQYMPLGDDERHVVMWGLGYRHSRDRTSGGPTLSFSPRTRSLDTFSGFLQNTVTLVPDELHLMVGSKFEHNDHTGFEIQPSGRLSWLPDENQTVWAAVSRAVRTPSRTADDTIFTTAFADTGLIGGGPPSGTIVPLQVLGNSSVDSEELIAYELGYRVRLDESLTFDLATFYNHYDDLITFSVPAGVFDNRGDADTYGVEVASTWDVSESWRLSASYTFLHVDFDSSDGNPEEGESPEQQFNLRSYLDLADDLELNSALYYVDNVPDEGADAYLRLDVGLTWRPKPNVEIAVWGQNLLDDGHFEFGDDLFQAVGLEVERSVYAQVSLRF